jgi:hypothetical protein
MAAALAGTVHRRAPAQHLKQKALTMANTSIRILIARAAACCALLIACAGPAWAAAPAAPTQASAGGPAATDAPTAPPAAPAGDFKSLDGEVQGLRKEVLDLNRDLFVLEEELLFPANTQVAVFLSLDVGTFFELDSVQLKLDNKEVANYLYTDREVEALNRGGVHRVFIGNLKIGKHELVAFFTGKGPHERDYKRGANLSFEKGVGAKYLELRISDRQSRQQPEFTVKEWE